MQNSECPDNKTTGEKTHVQYNIGQLQRSSKHDGPPGYRPLGNTQGKDGLGILCGTSWLLFPRPNTVCGFGSKAKN